MYTKFKSANESALRASKKVSYVIAHEDVAHTDRERFVKPCAFIWQLTDEVAARKIECCYLTVRCTEVQV